MIWSHAPCFSCINTKMSVKKVGNIYFLPCTNFSFSFFFLQNDNNINNSDMN